MYVYVVFLILVEVSSLFIKTTIKMTELTNSAVDQRVFSLIICSMEVIPRENLISFGVMFKQNKLIKKNSRTFKK